MIQAIINKAKKEHKKVYIYAHKFPDGDALGSSCALALYLKNQGIDAQYIITKPTYSYSNITGQLPTTTEIESPCISIILDTSTLAYCENTLFLDSSPQDIYVIDHHMNTKEGSCIEDELNLPKENIMRDDSQSSTCEILINMLDKELTSCQVSTLLTLGLITDTAKLQFIKEHTFQNLLSLLDLGANYEEVISACNHKKVLREEVGLAKLLLDSKRIKIGDTFGLIMAIDNGTVNQVISKYMLRNPQKRIFAMADIINCSFTCTCAENSPGEFDLEFRSTPIYLNLDVQKLAIKYGGGGHYNASGCHISKKDGIQFNDIISQIEQDITEPTHTTSSKTAKSTLTDNDKQLALLLKNTNRLTTDVDKNTILLIESLISAGANYTYIYKKFKTFEQFMLANEILNKIPESSLSQKHPIISIYLSKQEIINLCSKYNITTDDILKCIEIFSDINIKFATISLSGGKKAQINKDGKITFSNSAAKQEKTQAMIK